MAENGQTTGNKNGRDTSGKFTSGTQPGPGRTPRHAISNAVRRLVDPEAIAQFLVRVATDDRGLYTMNDRKWAIEMIYDRCEGKAVQAVALGMQTSPAPTLPSSWSKMSQTERQTWLAAAVATPVFQLGTGSDE